VQTAHHSAELSKNGGCVPFSPKNSEILARVFIEVVFDRTTRYVGGQAIIATALQYSKRCDLKHQ